MNPATGSRTLTGSCVCGQVRLRCSAVHRQAIACHCVQCRKQSGHFIVAIGVSSDDLEITGEQHLKWFQASSTARRGFCPECGSWLFWQALGSDEISIMTGCLDSPTGLRLEGHIHTAEKGDYYQLDDELPAYEHEPPAHRFVIG